MSTITISSGTLLKKIWNRWTFFNHDYQSTSPQLSITIFFDVLPERDPKDSIFLTTSNPSTTLPKTTCLPSNQGVSTVQIKNWDPFVFGPALAMDKIPAPVCLSWKFSSLNFWPYILLPENKFEDFKTVFQGSVWFCHYVRFTRVFSAVQKLHIFSCLTYSMVALGSFRLLKY